METEAVIGLAMLAATLSGMMGLVFWSRWRIERIARKGFRSPRQIEKELGDG